MRNVKYSGHTKIFAQILEKIEFNILRDYREATLLQESRNEPLSFVSKTIDRSINKIIDSLEYHLPDVGIVANGMDLKEEDTSNAGFVIIEAIPEAHTMQRGLPFFGLSLTYIKKENNNYNTLASYISFPVLNENIQTVLNDKCYVNQNIAKVSHSEEITQNSLIAIDNDLQTSKSEKYKQVNFFSLSYELLLLLQNKIDFVYRTFPSIEMLYGFELMLKNAGFLFEINKKDQTIKASNNKFKTLYEQI